MYLLITRLGPEPDALDHELYSLKPNFVLRRGIHELYEGSPDGGDMARLFPPPLCYYDDCLNEVTVSRTVDFDPADPEVGPQPDICTIWACTTEHLDAYLAQWYNHA